MFILFVLNLPVQNYSVPGDGMQEGKDRWIIAGLGNPGREYRETRHNIGFIMIDRLANIMNISLNTVRNKAIVGEGVYQEKRIMLMKPQTYMNLSGNAISQLVKFYKVSLQNLLVIHDDIDLPLGKLRIRSGGGSAGQKGMESTIEQIGSNEFPRLRIGIGRPLGRMDVADYVLTPFSGEDKEIIKMAYLQAEKAVITWLNEGVDAAMSRFNGISIYD